MNPDERMTVEVRVRMPWSPDPVRVAIDVAESVFRHSFAPLPSERELPWAFLAREEVDGMIAKRREVAGELGRMLASAILKAVSSRDPRNGYEPEDL